MVYQAWKDFPASEIVATSPFSEKIFDFIPISGRVLDLGCGNGRLSRLIKERGYQTFGIDINKNAISFVQSDRDLAGIDFSEQDARHTNFQDNFFDAVIEQAVLGCMELAERSMVLTEVYRILKLGGVLSIAEFGIRTDRADEYRTDAIITGEYGTHIVKRAGGGEWFRVHNFEKDEIDSLVKNAGFQIVSESHPPFSSLKGNVHPGHQYVLRKA